MTFHTANILFEVLLSVLIITGSVIPNHPPKNPYGLQEVLGMCVGLIMLGLALLDMFK